MKATMSVSEAGNKFKVEITIVGKGFDNKPAVTAYLEKFEAAAEIGMIKTADSWVAMIDQTPEAAEPFVVFAQENGLDIVQM